MTDDLSYPYLLLLASGGHCQYLAVLGANEIKRLGTTIDDAPGEVFDKVAKMLSLPIFSGSEVEKWAEKGDKNRFSFPLPLINKNDCDLSFSGLKSSVRRQVDYLVEKQSGLYLRDQRDICASFQKSMKLIFLDNYLYSFSDFLINNFSINVIYNYAQVYHSTRNRK